MRSALERYTTRVPPAESVARTQTPPAFRFRRHVARGAGLSPCTERHSAGHAKQRAAGPRWPEEPLAQLSWASPRTADAVASRHLRPGMSVGRPSLSVKMLPRVCRAAHSAALLHKRLLSGEGRATTRSGICDHMCDNMCMWSQMPVCDYWQCMVAQIAQAWRRAEAEPAPGSPRFGRASPPSAQGRASCGSEIKDAIGSKKMTPAPALAPK